MEYKPTGASGTPFLTLWFWEQNATICEKDRTINLIMVAGIAITMRHLPFEAYLIEDTPRHPS